MATTPPLIGRTVETKVGDQWVAARITEHNGGSIAVVPVAGRFPDGTTRIVATFPLTASDWRV